MLLNGHDEFRVAHGIDQSRLIDGLDGPDVDHGGIDSGLGEELGGREDTSGLRAGGNQTDPATGAQLVNRARREGVVGTEQIRYGVADDSQVDRAVVGLGPIHHGPQFDGVGRGENRQVGHRPHDRQVLDVEVGLADRADQQA